jgi:hypothetical protein
MGYELVNLKSGEIYSCCDELWRRVLEEAGDNSWEAEGTTIDFYFELEMTLDEMYSDDWNMLLMCYAHMKRINWDGNYIEKENQLVSDSDAKGLLRAITGLDADPALIAFLARGCFRIRSSDGEQ